MVWVFASTTTHLSAEAPFRDDRASMDLLIWADAARNASAIAKSDTEGGAAGLGDLADVSRLLIILLTLGSLGTSWALPL